tara:strand:- start:265 stop:681 length:417 start_codon:yes stop_codon:yes gene_type:complete
MASQLKVDTITGVTTAGSIAVTGEGNSTTTNLQQGLAKAWVRFNGGGTAAINDSFNIGSLTDNGTGLYTFAFSSNMGNVNFCGTATAKEVDSTAANNNGTGVMLHGYLATAVEYVCFSPDGNVRDPVLANMEINGDLA